MVCEVLPFALEDRPTLPPALKTLALTLETTPELFNWRDMMGMFGALESASKLLPSAEPWNTALPARLEMLALIDE